MAERAQRNRASRRAGSSRDRTGKPCTDHSWVTLEKVGGQRRS